MATTPLPTSQAPILLGVSWTFTGLSTLMVALRIYCRLRFVSKLWWDDFWMSVSLFFSWAATISWTVYCALGGANYDPKSPSRATSINELDWVSQVWAIVALVTGKIAIASLIARIQAPCLWRSIVLWTVPSIITAWCIAQIVMIFVQCRPTASLWDASIPGTCWDPHIVVANAQAIGAYFGFCDLLLAALPVQMIWKLQMPLRRKIGLSCLLSCGVVAFAMAVVKIVMLPADLDKAANSTRLSVLLYVWNTMEMNVVIIAGCVPTITPIFTHLKGKHAEPFRQGGAGPEKKRVFGQSVPSSWWSARRNLWPSLFDSRLDTKYDEEDLSRSDLGPKKSEEKRDSGDTLSQRSEPHTLNIVMDATSDPDLGRGIDGAAHVTSA